MALTAMLTAASAQAQDKIITKEGNTYNAYNVEVSDKYVFYNTEKEGNGAFLRMGKDSVLMVRFADGTKRMVADEDGAATPQAAPAAGNANSQPQADYSLSPEEQVLLREKYNPGNVQYLETSNKSAKAGYFQLDFCKDAVLADKNIEVELQTLIPDQASRGQFQTIMTNYVMAVSIRNKSDKMVYLDLANSFFIRGRNSEPYYVPTATSQTDGKTSGGSVNLGSVAGAMGIGGSVGKIASGINVGGSSSSISTTITYSQRIISIPPMSSVSLGARQIFTPDTKDSYDLKVASCTINKYYGVYTYLQDLKMTRGEERNWTEADSPMKLGTYITYSMDENLGQTSTVRTSLFAKRMIAIPRKGGGYYFPTANTKELTENYDKGLFFTAEFQ